MSKVLFLEDSQQFAKNYIAQLHQHGFLVHHLLDAGAAVQLVLKEPFDALVVDIQLPIPTGVPAHAVDDGNSTGIWFLEQVRERMLAMQLPTFVLTNNLAKHAERLDRFERRLPPLPDRLLQRTLKIDCSAKQFPPRLRAHVALFRTQSAPGS